MTDSTATAPSKWTVNGEAGDLSRAADILAPALEPSFLKTRGGLLFKACDSDGEFHLGAIPWVWQGERGRHYDIPLPAPEERHLIGTITAWGELSLLFRNPEISDEDRLCYRMSLGHLALLFARARPGTGWPLDGISRQLFEAAGLWKTAPESLGLIPADP